MRIIGIRLYETEWHSVNKVLTSGWYPFGDYPEPEEGRPYTLPERSSIEEKIYDLDANNPHIEVSCLIGMNGAGKSTLLDILYRLINNFSYVVLCDNEEKHDAQIRYADGLKADLYYEIEKTFYKICCRDKAIRFYQSDVQGLFYELNDLSGNLAVMNDFFFTISMNFSLYSLNPSDYEESLPYMPGSKPKMIDGAWVDTMLRRSDGYLTPMLVAPYRDKGNIDMRKENQLALERIVSIAILLSATSKLPLIDGYKVVALKYKIKRMYGESLRMYHSSKIWGQLYFSEKEVLGVVAGVWERKLGERLLSVKDSDTKDLEKYDVDVSCRKLLLDYLAYETIQLCTKYEEYASLLSVERISRVLKYRNSLTSNTITDLLQSMTPEMERVIDKLIDPRNTSFKNLGIRQGLEYIESGLYRDGSGEEKVNKLIKGRNIRTLDDVIMLLPPPFYDVDIVLEKENRKDGEERISISSMSSGERQLLYSLSYVLYHLKNIQSISPSKKNPAYNHVNLVFDEAELYFHPEYQRVFLKRIIDYIARCNLDKSVIKSINIIIATHSPFVISDMLTSNTLCLSEGRRSRISNQSFGANFYDLLQDNFFFENSSIGEVSSTTIRKWLQAINEGDNRDVETIVKLIGDPLLINYFLSGIAFRRDVQN